MMHLSRLLQGNQVITRNLFFSIIFLTSIIQTLTELRLSDNQIGPEGVGHINQGLQGNQVIATTLPSFIHLDLRIQKLTHLYLENNHIGDEGMAQLSQTLQQNQVILVPLAFIFFTSLSIHLPRHLLFSNWEAIKLEIEEQQS